MSGNTLHLLLILLAFSHIIALNPVSTSRTGSLVYHSQDIIASKYTHQKFTEESMEEMLIKRRRELQHDDYSGSGANDRHTPKPPVGRS